MAPTLSTFADFQRRWAPVAAVARNQYENVLSLAAPDLAVSSFVCVCVGVINEKKVPYAYLRGNGTRVAFDI